MHVVLSLLVGVHTAAAEEAGFDLEHLASIRSAYQVHVSPDGEHVAYLVSNPRRPGVDEDGSARTTLHVTPADGVGPGNLFAGPDTGVRQVAFTDDSAYLTFLSSVHEDDGAALWALPLAGGQARRILTLPGGIHQYDVSPDGSHVVVMGDGEANAVREAAQSAGYVEDVFEEDHVPDRVWVLPIPTWEPLPPTLIDDPGGDVAAPAEALPIPDHPYNVDWTPDGNHLIVATTPRGLIDDTYVATSIRVVDPATGDVAAIIPTEGKVGSWSVSPDSQRIALIAARGPYDPAAGRLSVGTLDGSPLVDQLPNFEGHVRSIAWVDDDRVMYLASQGVETKLGRFTLSTGTDEILDLSDGTEAHPNWSRLAVSGDTIALTGHTPTHPSELYTLDQDGTPTRRTRLNPWLDEIDLATQQVITWKARDGLQLEGLLITPEGPGPHPLLLMVHGGPESHDTNGWLTYYGRPGQVAASRGFAVLYPNYRGSTGRGVDFSRLSQADPAGREFDDLIDAIKHLVRTGVADRDRVGITGGSYGGFATAWGATKLTKHFRAGVMFVGVSNLVSKGFTTDAPLENIAVHLRSEPWVSQTWRLNRSPIAHVQKARTPLLIAGGTRDTRVHPSESLQLYRALQLVGETPVRWVRYPGEGHGNRAAAARDDYARRLIRWMEHFVRDGQTDLPPRDLPVHGPAPTEAAAQPTP